jgi:flagellar motility protein MotE (MotC chaperone)
MDDLQFAQMQNTLDAINTRLDVLQTKYQQLHERQDKMLELIGQLTKGLTRLVEVVKRMIMAPK